MEAKYFLRKINSQITKTALAIYWALYFAYDIYFDESFSSAEVAVVSWLVTCYLAARWGSESSSSYFVKIITVIASAASIMISFVYYADQTWNIFPETGALYQVVALILLQTILASIFAGLVAAFPLAAMFQRGLLPAVLLACAPVMAIQIEAVLTGEQLTTRLLLLFEVVFLPIAVWRIADWSQELTIHEENCGTAQ